MGVYLGAEKVDEVGLALVTKLGRLKESEYMELLEVPSIGGLYMESRI